MIWRAGLVWVAMAGAAGAVDLTLPPSARLMVERDTGPDSYVAPIAVYSGGIIPNVVVEGSVLRSVWRLESPGLTALQVARPLRSDLIEQGFAIVFECAASQCGGFDFRFATEVLPAPIMYVNLRSYQFLTAIKGAVDAPDEVVTVLASTTDTSAHIQIIHVDSGANPTRSTAGAADESPTDITPTARLGNNRIEAGLIERGHIVLSGLEFDTGTSALGQGEFASLSELAEFLTVQPEFRIALVGHTDSVGALEANIALSRNRAASVRQRLISDYGVDGARVDAQGMGYLSPVASNLTNAGREENRRVEAVLLTDN